MKNEVWGMNWDNVESQSLDGPKVGKYTFQLISAKRGVNRKGKPYVNVACKVIQAEDKGQVGKVHYEYLSLEPERLGFTKAFFEGIGAGNCLRPNKGPGDAEGCVFTANVVATTSDAGQEYRNLRNMEAALAEVDDEDDDVLGDEDEDEDDADEDEEDDDDEPPPPEKSSKRTSPVKAKTGRRR